MDWNKANSIVATSEGLQVDGGTLGATPRPGFRATTPGRRVPQLPEQPDARVVDLKHRIVLCEEWQGPVGEFDPSTPVKCKVTGTQTGISFAEVVKIAQNYLTMTKGTCGAGYLISYWVRIDRLDAKAGYVSQWVPVWKSPIYLAGKFRD